MDAKMSWLTKNMPIGWELVRHKDVASINPPKPRIVDETDVSFIPMRAVAEESGEISGVEVRCFSAVKKGYTTFVEGDLLFAKITPCMENGKVAVARGLKNGYGAGSTEFLVSRLHPELDPDFYFYFFVSRRFRQLAQASMTGSAGQLRVPVAFFENVNVPLPSLAEQTRIVAKIEALFSELDKGLESLTTARTQLKTYRQALLKHAFQGKLTEQWRKDHADELETADQLLARIREERVARHRQQLEDWEAEVALWEAGGKPDKKPRKPTVPVEVEPLHVDQRCQLPMLPGLWQWRKLGELFSVYVGATPSRKNPAYWGGEIRWVSSGEVAFCGISETREHITQEGLTNTSTLVHPSGTVILAMIGEGKTRGQAAILHTEAAHNQNTAAIRVSESGLDPRYVYYFLLYRYEETRRVGSGNNQKALNKTLVQEMGFPLAPLSEQRQLVEFVETSLSQIDQLEQTIATALQQAEALRQSILKRAFEGKLVPQDPNDEPAAELLARIRVECAAQPQPKRGRRQARAEA